MNRTYEDALKSGRTVQFRPAGNSMKPLIKSKQLVTIEPVRHIKVDDIVFCRVKGKYLVHKVSAIDSIGGRYQISNNKGRVNGWISANQIFGKVTRVEE